MARHVLSYVERLVGWFGTRLTATARHVMPLVIDNIAASDDAIGHLSIQRDVCGYRRQVKANIARRNTIRLLHGHTTP